MAGKLLSVVDVEQYLDEDIGLFYGNDADIEDEVVKHFTFGYICSLYDLGRISDDVYEELSEKLLKKE